MKEKQNSEIEQVVHIFIHILSHILLHIFIHNFIHNFYNALLFLFEMENDSDGVVVIYKETDVNIQEQNDVDEENVNVVNTEAVK